MALLNTTITTTQPAGLVAAENPIVLSLATGTNGSPAYAKTKLVIGTVPTDGLTLTFDLDQPTTYSKQFIAKNFPSQDNYFLTSTIQDREGNTVSTGITSTQSASSLAE